MKKFTRVALILSAAMACIGLFCLIGSFAMGMSWSGMKQLAQNGKFKFYLGGIGIGSTEKTESTERIDQDIKKLDIELGAGSLEIYYDDVDEIQIWQDEVVGFKSEMDGDTLEISGGTGVGVNNGGGSIVLTIPEGMKFEEVQLEVGAGEAWIDQLKVDYLNVEVGAGEANFGYLDAKTMDAEVGVGELSAQLAGSESDYNYKIESGIGEIEIGDNSYGGFARSQNITNPGAERSIDMECGIGSVSIYFEEF